jgi:hypothetical protein
MTTDTSRPSTEIDVPQLPYIIDEILPRNEISVITGPSGSGCGTLMLQIMDDLANGLEIFGKRSYPMPYVYVSVDRSRKEVARQFGRLGINLAHVLILEEYVKSDGLDRNFNTLLHLIGKRPRMLFVSGLNLLCPGKVTDDVVVTNFLMMIRRVCQETDLTILALLRSAKARQGEGYQLPRERIIGCGAWAQLSSAKYIIEPTNPKDPTDLHRQVLVLPRNAAAQKLAYEMDEESGRLMECDANEPLEQPELMAWIQERKGTVIKTNEVVGVGAILGIKRRTVERWLKAQKELGELLPLEKGKYMVPSSPQ